MTESFLALITMYLHLYILIPSSILKSVFLICSFHPLIFFCALSYSYRLSTSQVIITFVLKEFRMQNYFFDTFMWSFNQLTFHSCPQVSGEKWSALFGCPEAFRCCIKIMFWVFQTCRPYMERCPFPCNCEIRRHPFRLNPVVLSCHHLSNLSQYTEIFFISAWKQVEKWWSQTS